MSIFYSKPPGGKSRSYYLQGLQEALEAVRNCSEKRDATQQQLECQDAIMDLIEETKMAFDDTIDKEERP